MIKGKFIIGNILILDVPITSFKELKELADNNRSVYCSRFSNSQIKAAALVLNMQYEYVHNLMKDSKIYSTINLDKVKRFKYTKL